MTSIKIMIKSLIILLSFLTFLIECHNSTISYNFCDKVILITASSTGIGAQTAIDLAKSGAQVVITGRNSESIGKKLKECEKVPPYKSKFIGVVADISKEEDLKRLVNETIKEFKRIDILVNNVGIGDRTPITSPDFMKTYKNLMNVNLDSIVYLTHL